jgi:hypothetical protein
MTTHRTTLVIGIIASFYAHKFLIKIDKMSVPRYTAAVRQWYAMRIMAY